MKKVIGLLSSISPKLTTKILFRRAFKRKLNLKNPVTLNEKIQWLKLYDYKNNKLVTKCADKYLVREYISELGLGELLNELYYVYDDYKSIDFDQLPNQFVLKCNHGAGYNIICTDKSKLDKKEFYKKIIKWYKEDYWKKYTEINYKNIEKKIIVEKLLVDKNGNLPIDYKIYCFNGEPKALMVCVDRDRKQPKFLYYDENWNLLLLSEDAINNPDIKIDKPQKLSQLFEYARILSKDFKFVRVDLYYIDDKIYFGELTFTPTGGLDYNRLESTDLLLGSYLDINGG